MKNYKILHISLILIGLYSCNIKIKSLNDDRNYSIEVNGKERSFIIDIPPNYTPLKKYSLAIILHGGGRNGEAVSNYTEKVENLDFIMVYPDGIDGNWRYNKGFENYSEDLVFIKKLAKAIKQNYSIDKDRVYLGGISLGGQMTYSSGVYIPQEFSAIGVVSTALQPSFIKKSDNLAPLSLLHIHAKNDDVFLYDNVGLSALSSISNWNKINKSNTNLNSIEIMDGITKNEWLSTVTDTKTQLITYDKGGHNYLPYSEDLIIDFFYNTPPRGNRVSLNLKDLRSFYYTNDKVEIGVDIDDLDSIEEVIYTIDGNIHQTKSPDYPSFLWIPKEEGLYRLGAYIKLKNGEVIYSAISMDILIIRPYKRGNFTTKASSVENYSFNSNLIVDGDLTTRWASSYEDDQEVVVDLGKIEDINGLTILWEDAYASSYQLHYSIDNEDWVALSITKENPGPDYFRDPIRCRYIKIVGKKRSTNWGYSIYELLIH